MKDFFKYMLATVCGIVAMSIVAGIIFMISFASMIASGNAAPEVKDNSVLVLKMSGAVSEQVAEGTPFDALLGTADMENLGLDDILKAIEAAKNNDHIKGIYIEGGTTTFDAPATAQQIRHALQDFKKSGKVRALFFREAPTADCTVLPMGFFPSLLLYDANSYFPLFF